MPSPNMTPSEPKSSAPQSSGPGGGSQGLRAASRSRAVPALALALLFMAGCYSYRPLLNEPPSPGDDVRVRLSAPAAERIDLLTGHPLRTLEGRVQRVAPDSLVLDVGWGALFAGTPFAARRDTILFQEREILEIETRELSRARTGLVIGGIVAAVALVLGSLSGGGQGTDPGNGETPF